MRVSASSMPSKRPIGVRNWLRTRAYAPVPRTASLDMPTFEEGSEIERPAARHSISIRQPWPAIFADGELLCGLHARDDGVLDAFGCV